MLPKVLIQPLAIGTYRSVAPCRDPSDNPVASRTSPRCIARALGQIHGAEKPLIARPLTVALPRRRPGLSRVTVGPKSVTLSEDAVVILRADIERSRKTFATCVGRPDRQLWAAAPDYGAQFLCGSHWAAADERLG